MLTLGRQGLPTREFPEGRNSSDRFENEKKRNPITYSLFKI